MFALLLQLHMMINSHGNSIKCVQDPFTFQETGDLFLKVAIPMEWIISLLVILSHISIIKWGTLHSGIINQQSCNFLNFKFLVVPLHLDMASGKGFGTYQILAHLSFQPLSTVIVHRATPVTWVLWIHSVNTVFKWEWNRNDYLLSCVNPWN